MKKNQAIWIKGKNKKNCTSWQKNQCPGKKKVKGHGVIIILSHGVIIYSIVSYIITRRYRGVTEAVLCCVCKK